MKTTCINIFLISFMTTLLHSCGNTIKYNSTNLFYVDYISDNDSLLIALKKSTSGKAAYFDYTKQLQIVPVPYLTEEHPNTHYFKIIEELQNIKPEFNTIKYQLTFNNSRINDSIAYSLKKFIYTKEGWKPKSDMGQIKIFDYLADYDKKLKIINANIAARVIKTITIDSFDK